MPRALIVLVLAVGVLLGPAGPAAAAALPEGVTWTATIDDQNVDRSTGGATVELDPSEPVQVVVRIENQSSEPVSVSYVRLEGGVLGLKFYAYSTQVDMVVPPGEPGERAFPVRLLDLAEQASGLLPSKITLLDAEGEEIRDPAEGGIAAKAMRADIRGEFDSVYTVFGLAVGGMALVLLVGVLWRLVTGRLSPNRWRRGLSLAAPGLGLGFLLTFTLSAFRLATPDPELWGALLFGGAALGFVAGYLSPTPGDQEEPGEEPDGELEDELLEPGADEEPADHEPNVVQQLRRPDDRSEEPTRSDRWRS